MKTYGSGLIAKIVSSLTTPAAGTRHLQPKSDGWYDIDSTGAAVGPLTAGASGVTSVNTRTGAVTLTSADVGLANVPNVDATARANHTGTQPASTITGLATIATSGSANNLVGGTVPNFRLPVRLQALHSADVSDWNLATETGWYEGLSTATNTPFGAARSFLGHVIANDANWIVQTLYDFTVNAVDHGVYTRRRSTGGWGPWLRTAMGLQGVANATSSYVAYVPRRSGHLRLRTTSYLGTRFQRLPLLMRATGNFYLGSVVDEGVEAQAPFLSSASIAVIATDYIGITVNFNPNGAALSDVYNTWRWDDFDA